MSSPSATTSAMWMPTTTGTCLFAPERTCALSLRAIGIRARATPSRLCVALSS